ncbi:MAG TPA: methyl-accepting chemotaxis protein, partial [Bradyrhizobium sp.]|nr:methyl-accepting chemotaxis protein [Bradyrhizobium sp.]
GDQINQAIQQLDKVTQQNASASEQMSATSEELAAQSEQLQASIAYFRIDAAGAVSQRRPAQPVARIAAPKRVGTAPRAAKAKFGNAKPVAARNGHANGFALNLANGAGDAHDAEFEKY